jgi:hypothetical protein
MKSEPPNITMTAVAVLCLQLSGHALDAETHAGVGALRNLEFQWQGGEPQKPDQRGTGAWPLYAWYYITQARFHQGGKTWMGWNRQFASALCNAQNADGSWCPPPNSAEAPYGPVYCTTLSTLMLEVYYRFLPTYKPIEVQKAEPTEERGDEEEIVIRFG